MSSLKKGGQTPKTPRASKADPHLCRPSSYLDILLPPLQQLLVLLSDVLAAVKVDASQVLPLVRIMIGCLGVDALPRVFQVKAAGLAVAVFGALPEQRAVLLAELLSSTGLLGASSAAAGGGGGAASARSPPREFLAQDEPPIQIQVSTALLLQLIQATALLPAIEESDLQLIQDLCKVPIGWCDRLWVTLLEKLPAAKSASLDVKAFLDHFVQDLLAVQHTPEWPGAQLLLRRLVMALNTSKGLQHPESAVRLACIDLLGTITSAFMADCKQAEEEQEKVEALLAASGYDADAEREGGAYLGDEDKARVEALQRLLLGALAARPSSGTRHTARTLLVQQMLLQRAIFEQQQPPVMSSQPQDLIPPVEPPEPPAKGRKGRKGQAAAAAAAAQAEAEREKEQRRELALAQQGSALLAEFHALHAAPPRVAVGTDAGSAASISRWLLLNSAMGRGRGSFLLWLVNAGSAVGKGGGVSAGYQPTSTAERSRAVKALGSAIEMDERVLGHVDVQAAVCAALEDDAVSVREAAVELLGRHISHSPELAMTYFDLIGRASNDAGLSVRKRAVKVLWDCCVHCGSAAAPTGAYLDAGAPAFTRACEAVSLIMARAADPEDSMRKLATGLCAGLLFTSGSHPAVADADMEAAGGFPGASLAAAAKGSPSARAMLLAEVCDLVYHSDAPTNIKLPLPSDHSLVVVLKAILGQSSTSQPIAGGGGALAAQAAAVQQGAAELARALLEKTMELQEAAAAASGALDAALAGTSSRAHPAAAFAPAAAGSSAANGTGVGGPPDAGSPQRQGGAVPPPASAWPQGGGEAVPGRAFQGATEQEAVSGRGDARPNTHAATVAAAQASLGRAELQQLHCLLALHALCAADVGVLVQAHGGAAYFARGVAPYFKELVTVGDKSPAPSKRARSERVMCAMHIVAALAGRAEGGQTRLEAGLVKDLVSDLQLIIGRHLFVSVVSSAVQCMCALSRPHPNLVTQQIVGLAARYHLMLENDLNGGLTETSPYRSMYPKLLFILGNFCRYAAHILDSCAGMQVRELCFRSSCTSWV
ncbi:hypothetical protein DUNSADRAFT_14347 [Dunaliella salina]|uniref:Sister chromatid cohesion protein n=1 Tax=Dunaliella salina TaxID=3046 RepID=A0ABQ7G7H4_DUNSA|nr:hypothetical protein DUNSADRAFT_14347 [Dunaliella salina]|eukprot:KAF5830563.1 hypothetical protein DUNSADRAFT_14347 [Dunaliella salina]